MRHKHHYYVCLPAITLFAYEIDPTFHRFLKLIFSHDSLNFNYKFIWKHLFPSYASDPSYDGPHPSSVKHRSNLSIERTETTT